MRPLDASISKVLLASAAFLIFAYLIKLRTQGRTIYDRVERQGSSVLLSKSVMEIGYWALQPLCRASVRLGISANLISFAAVLFGALAGVSLGLGHFGIAAALGIFGGALDALDGMVARATGSMNQAGKVLDSALDRYVEFFLFIGLIAFYHPILWAQLLTCAALVGSIMVSYTTALGEITQVQLPRGSMQRAERLVYLLLGLILTPLSTPFGPNASMGSQVISFPMIFSLSLIACIANLSAMSRLRWIRRAVTEREERLISLTLAQVRSVRPSPRTPPPRFGT